MSIYDLTPEELIKQKELCQKDIWDKNSDLAFKQRQIKGVETNLILKTDFKALGYTNEKQRTAFVEDQVHGLKTEVDLIKQELQLHKDHLTIINDLLKLRMEEVKTE